jgi:hypothetical protein
MKQLLLLLSLCRTRSSSTTGLCCILRIKFPEDCCLRCASKAAVYPHIWLLLLLCLQDSLPSSNTTYPTLLLLLLLLCRYPRCRHRSSSNSNLWCC